jgi:hypothetical protein
MKLTIVYWNTVVRDSLAVIALYDRREPDIITVQEPWVSKQTKTIYCLAQGKYQ